MVVSWDFGMQACVLALERGASLPKSIILARVHQRSMVWHSYVACSGSLVAHGAQLAVWLGIFLAL